MSAGQMVPNGEAAATPHTLEAGAVAAQLRVRMDAGLSAQEALERLARVGPNRLPQAQARSP